MPKGFRGRTIVFDSDGSPAPAAGTLVSLSAALGAITRVAHEAPSFESGMAQALEILCTALNWPIGHVYTLADAKTPTLTSASIWHLADPALFSPFQAATEQVVFHPGHGLVGQVLAHARPGLSPDVSRDIRFLRRQAARETGVRAWIGVPIIVEGRVVAVAECFTTERVTLDAAVAGLLSCVGMALSRLYERERWNAERAMLLQQIANLQGVATKPDRAMLSALAGAVAHEINSPLFAARTSLALLGAETPDEPLIAGAQDELARIAAVLETLHTLAQEAPLGQRLQQFIES